MDDWESEDFVPVPPVIAREKPKGAWDDEDAEEEDVKESWEDEEATQAPAASKPEMTKPEMTKPDESKSKIAEVKDEKLAQSKSKTAEIKDEKLAESKSKIAAVKDEKPADPLAEKLRQQRLVEEADYQATKELFGKTDGDKSLDSFIPKSEEDFMDYAELVAQKLRPFEKSFHYITLLKAVMRHAMVTLKGADAKEVASSTTIIANEKLKAEKEANAGKKKSGLRKKQLHVDKPDDDTVVGAYDDIADYDFM